MSANTQKDSASFKDMLTRAKVASPQQQQRTQPVTAAPENRTGYARGVRGLNKDGYETYNIDDSEVYIGKVPESILFNDGEEIVVKAQPGVLVGLYRPRNDVTPKTIYRNQGVPENDIFEDVKRGSSPEVSSFVGTCQNGIIKRKPEIRTR